jgi:hypothetical protein
LITLRKYFRRYTLIAKIRLTLVVLFAVFLLTSMIAAISMPPSVIENNENGRTEVRSRVQRLSFLVPLLLILVGFSTALVCILYDPEGRIISSHSSDTSTNSISALVRRVTDSKKQGGKMHTLCPARLGKDYDVYYM